MTIEHIEIPVLFNQLESSLVKVMEKRKITNPIVIGIHTGGVWVAEKMHQCLKIEEPLGLLDISFYRDDFSQIRGNPKVKQSKLPLTVEGRDIILIDDVFYTGRTVRAALNEIFDYGRPRQVILGVLIERNGRQVPLRPDCIGAEISLAVGQRIKLTGPEPLDIVIQSVP
ncbi:MAG: bifunctional pyr operon transcriptional regulator/uracil phosphoribosyltransferase PyrR [Gammaproteobacteria bacterium]|jgi:pyrimidine operon attenuation protein / uracil phosphoribosyltransferase|nr:bifunctional pyr operon transcriptional regulator/uracil phosphoribosyltransferase PyrR [Gammaproteobacteria bacterium]MBT5222175.1 bifunctional pyr operon transcriptional regulator/uracil phosphoribosyltransferase PyrR [Gammaproteobacteria bacterium]MBT5826927.1 bifunctional pyr operon transcriptional regulator/uracil phosphoribosyltransferase PyrR [Gammaproteobacteria bacterium]MBT5967264.1 bifunctional pyr operon transcriptional regulator/uracil phosphoribosyltransferase PyrR [Gammaproteob